MRINIASDHAGYEFKQILLDKLRDEGHDVVDHGALTYNPGDDYPAFCISVGEAVAAEPGSLGIVLGGSGNGEQMAANKVVGVRAALAWNAETARLARAHNDANVISLGWRQLGLDEAMEIVQAFLDEPFTGDERHQRRITQISEYEAGRGSSTS
ncbi:MAG: ribose-5-phosphate isomerase [Demequinaceae bacterium]|nr:ribose-5-phosphate isomerase [Demequinaceae bacterium]